MPASVHDARFQVGDIVHHRLFGYLGVVFKVDPVFDGSDDWYARMARSKPPRDRPWYQVLVHGAVHTTYVAERNLDVASAPQPIDHPLTKALFAGFNGTRYIRHRKTN